MIFHCHCPIIRYRDTGTSSHRYTDVAFITIHCLCVNRTQQTKLIPIIYYEKLQLPTFCALHSLQSTILLMFGHRNGIGIMFQLLLHACCIGFQELQNCMDILHMFNEMIFEKCFTVTITQLLSKDLSTYNINGSLTIQC